MEDTLFSNVSFETLLIYREHGFDWEDPTYINIFRWIWNVKHYHPHIDAFPGDESNKAFVILESPKFISKPYKFAADSYDDAIIKLVNYISENYEAYLK